MNKKKHKNRIRISEIEYYEDDKQKLLEYIHNYKSCELPKHCILSRKKYAKSLAKANIVADELLKRVEKPVAGTISAEIHQLYYKYQNAKKIYPNHKNLSSKTEKKIDSLMDYAATIESGRLYDKRQKLASPMCADLSFFLRRSSYPAYFNGGINQLVNLDGFIYPLEIIDSFVSSSFTERDNHNRTKRMFYIHVGKTNSGKTYTSLQMMKKAEKGAYLSPLRLLALEVSDTLNSEGIPCSFVTGEEERLVENATHIASTVELADFHTEYDVAVIDECQMISDFSRGHAWTKAIMNMRAREICLCTAPEALDVLVKLIDACGDFYEIINHRRKTPLVVEDTPFSITDVRQGDALVAFSKQKVNAIGAQLIKNGVNVSVLYGALPYSARKQQFENFASGKSTVLVTTDAIGMGVNLPVRRVIFMEAYKYDGENSRLLTSPEIKQIAGRAGRRGKFDTGYVNANGKRELEYIRKQLGAKNTAVKGICVNFPKKILTDDNISLKKAVEAWDCYAVPMYFVKESLYGASGVIEKIAKIYKKLDMEKNKTDIFEMATMPVDSRNIAVRKLWFNYIEQRLSGYSRLEKPYLRDKSVDELLTFSKMLDTYFLCSKSWNMEIDFDWLDSKRRMCNDALIDGLIDDVENHTRYCEVCGKMLNWDNRSDCCEDCVPK
jgi:hypothetical protein